MDKIPATLPADFDGWDEAAPAEKPEIAKGSTVTLKDGSRGEVAYVHPQMRIARVKVGGKTRTINLKELSHA